MYWDEGGWGWGWDADFSADLDVGGAAGEGGGESMDVERERDGDGDGGERWFSQRVRFGSGRRYGGDDEDGDESLEEGEDMDLDTDEE